MNRGPLRTASLTAGIEISHHNMQDLPGSSRVVLGCDRLRAAALVAVVPRDGGQPGAPAANEPCFLGGGDASLERPISNLSCRRARNSQRRQSLGLQRIGYDSFQDSAGSVQ